MDDEPLRKWGLGRAERRARATDRLRAVPLTERPHSGSHADPAAPRAIPEFDGTQWVTLSIAVDLDAKAVLYPPQPKAERPAEWDRLAMGKRQGRAGIRPGGGPWLRRRRRTEGWSRPCVAGAHSTVRSARVPPVSADR
ncbi:DUF6087 family protein [Streptomyces sp. NPDC001787]|uniref:DUF6087 family protein n=1 Tax=Streptomyces sp. NPDC001787 TaxID=3154523 RepID=UPI0033169AF7